MRYINQNEIQLCSLTQLKWTLFQNNNDTRVIRLSDHGIRFRFPLATENFFCLYIYIQSMYQINEIERVFILHLEPAAAIVKFVMHFSLSSSIPIYFIIWHSLILAHNSICHCFTIGTFHFPPRVLGFIHN